jgi:DNA-binding response OmpR family regulator
MNHPQSIVSSLSDSRVIVERCPHCGGKIGADKELSWGGWTLRDSWVTRADSGEVFRLRQILVTLMSVLIRSQGRLVSKEGVWIQMYGERSECDQPEIKIVDVQLLWLRKSIGKNSVETVWGRGMRLAPCVKP